MAPFTVGSLFSGVGGFDLGFERAGMGISWQAESDHNARKVLNYHWPSLKLFENVTEVNNATASPVDLICGGFPCQDLSAAGHHAGLAGERSRLWWEFHRIIGELSPLWVVIENVPGLLSSNGGRDMGTVLRALGELGYGFAYRVLDAQYFGVAQRRRRVFVVGHFGNWPAASEVLFEPEGVRRDSASCSEEGPNNSRETLRGLVAEGGIVTAIPESLGTGGPDAAHAQAGWLIPTGPPHCGVRRLTPTEIERLQGFPDGWTSLGVDSVYRQFSNKSWHVDVGVSDGTRISQMGNAVTVPVAQWLGQRILKVSNGEKF